MYSKKILGLLKGINEGDRIEAVTKGHTYSGILMPRSELGDPDYLIVKLNNGYNVGLKYESTMKVKKTAAKIKTVAKKTVIKQNTKLPPISLISTGGTIINKVDYKTGGVSPSMNVEDLIEAVPELLDVVYIKDAKDVFQLASEDMSPDQWIKTAKVIEKELNSDMKGVVVMHGQ